MSGPREKTYDLIVSTLLQVVDKVLEVDGSGRIYNTWYSPDAAPDVQLFNDRCLIAENLAAIRACLECRKKQKIESSAHADGSPGYVLQLLPSHPENGKLFLTVDVMTGAAPGGSRDSNWEAALDAAGDGRWDVFVPDLAISFSDKWHATFGYSGGQLQTIDQWVALIHPHDVEAVQKHRSDYFEGRAKYYSAEFRLLCSNGEYRWVLSRGTVVSRNEKGEPVRFTGTHTDIHERKLSEERYASAAQMLSKLINNLQDGILVTDEHKRLVYANQTFCDIYNLSASPDTLTGMDVYESILSRKPFYLDPEYFYQRTVEILHKKELVLGEEWKMLNGKTLSRDFIPLTLGANNKGGIWKFRDITEQKNVEKRLADLRNFYEQILNSITADIVVYDAQHRYVFINPSAVKNPDIRQWLIGKTDADYARLRNKPYDFVEKRWAILDKARDENREIRWEDTIPTSNGDTEYHVRYMYPVFDAYGKHLYGIGYGFNVTDRIKAEQELKTSRDTFASAFDESGIGMALVSPEGAWLDANNVLCAMTGYSKEELQRINFRDITHPDDLELDAPLLKKLYRGEIASYSLEKRFISRFNKIVQALLTVSLVRDPAGKPEFYIAQVVDITDKKELEWTLYKKNADLELTRENLLAKIHQLEDLSHIVAHNLRGPAGSIKLIAETMLDIYRGGSGKEISGKPPFTEEEAMLLIHEGASALMDSLSTLMRITEIKLNKEIPRDHCDINAMINEICNQLQSVIFEKKALILRDLDVTDISYPRMYLENILYNLLSNALKYTRPGVRPEILIVSQMRDGRTVLIIKDNGLGIDLQKYGHRVFRLNEVFHAGYDSKGVGLYITKTQVESFGGSIELNSKPNEGCEFVVTL